MPVTINGTTGVTTPGATVGAITGILKATSGVVSQAVAGTDYLTSTSGGAITLATAQTATGTSVDFTGIPSWVKRITVMFSGVSTNGAGNVCLQLGDSGGIENTGYVGSHTALSASTVNTVSTTANIHVYSQASAADLFSGVAIICLIGSNTWAVSGSTSSAVPRTTVFSGSKTLSDTLDRIRITAVNGTDTFDAGTINISYE